MVDIDTGVTKVDNDLLISLLMPVYNPKVEELRMAIESVLDQSYMHWELCIVDDGSTDEHVQDVLAHYASKDARVKLTRNKSNRHISVSTNIAFEMSMGSYVGLLDHDDWLWPQALEKVVMAIDTNQSDVLYTNEDKIDNEQRHFEPFYKPDFCSDLLYRVNYVNHFLILKRDFYQRVNGMREGLEGAQDWDLLLRACELTTSIYHLDEILYSWRVTEHSTASRKSDTTQTKSYAYGKQRSVLQSFLERNELDIRVSPSRYLGVWKYAGLDFILPDLNWRQWVSLVGYCHVWKIRNEAKIL